MINKKSIAIIILLIAVVLTGCSFEKEINPKKEIAIRLEPSSENPRNSEGDFIKLNNGKILFVYTHYTGGSGDNASAYLAGRYSSDGGKTWDEKSVTILPNEGGLNVMSVSLFRLANGEIALFYLRKNNESDCIPYMRTSNDEAQSWGEAQRCIPDSGYFVVNNDRVIRLKSGRIIFPTSLHKTPNSELTNIGIIRCYYSDDEGKTWNKSNNAPNPDNATTQEPGIVELKDGRIMLFARTESGTQYISFSNDNGENWSSLKPSNIKSPLSPAAIERIPQTEDLLLVWNNNYKPIRDGGNRTPFNLAISKDEGETWELIKTIEGNPNGWYCYTAIEFVEDGVLLGHCAGDRTKNVGLSTTQITHLNYDWLYSEATPTPIIKTDGGEIVELNCSDKNAEIYFSLDRKMSHKLYKSPIRVTRTTPLWVYAKSKGKSDSELITTYVGTKILQSSLTEPIIKGDGIIYNYYEGSVKRVKNIEKLNLKSKGVLDKFNIGNRMVDTSFAFVFKGFIEIPKDGEYTFYLASNDGSVLILDNSGLINHDGPHGMTEESAVISLGKGQHKIEVKYFQMLGGKGLLLSWKGPEFQKEEIPKKVLSH